MRPLDLWYFLCILVVFVSSSLSFAQNIPPLIGTEIKNPGIKFPNPMEQTGPQRQNDHGQQSPTKAQEVEINKFIEGLTSAYSNRNREIVVSAYAQDPGLIIYWNGKQLNGASQFKEALEGWLNQVDTLSIELQQLDTHIFGRFAWVASQCLVKTYKGSVESELEGTMTWVLERKRSAWVILHEHRTLLPVAPK